MKEEIADLWADVLESNKYGQTKGSLCKKDAAGFAYCCLGVLCKLHEEATGEGHFDDQPNSQGNYNYTTNTGVVAEAFLSYVVMIWAGMKNGAGHLHGNDLYSLAVQNDDGRTFKEIAQIIRENKVAL